MSNHKKLFLSFVAICLWNNALANSRENCDCDIFQIFDSNNPKIIQNFTRGPKHLIFESTKQYLMWWSKKEKKWLWDFGFSENLISNIKIKESCWISGKSKHCFEPGIKPKKNFSCPTDSKKAKWTLFFEQPNSVIKSRCLTDENECQINENNPLTFEATAIAPCVFPFKYRNREYKNCIKDTSDENKVRRDKFWCATSTREDLSTKTYGFCHKSCLSEEITSPSEEITGHLTTIVVSVSVSLFLLMLSIVFIVCCYMKRKMKKLTLKPTIDSGAKTQTYLEMIAKRRESNLNAYSPEIENQVDIIQNENCALINPNLSLNEQAQNISYSGKYEIDRDKFKIGQLLGGGSFGSVFEGSAEDLIQSRRKIKVAIKTVNNPLDHSQLYALMCEIKVLDMLDLHLNLVNMLGACTSQIRNGHLWLILEYCPCGDMKSFLLKNKNILKKNLKRQAFSNGFDERLLIKWAHDISKGMEYLSSKKIMHGDLAARNILIGTHEGIKNTYVAKISDFGLSRPFYDTTSYKKQKRKAIPWKWMDIEFLETGKFTMHSDVWSFGVVLWEMASMGRIPYVGLNANEIVDQLRSGFRLQPPNEINDVPLLINIYDEVTKGCWKLDPKHRWSFSDLVEYFETYLTMEEKKECQRLEESYKQMQNIISQRKSSSNNQAPESTKMITTKTDEQEAVYHKFKGTLSNDIELSIHSVEDNQNINLLNDNEVNAELEINVKSFNDKDLSLENNCTEQAANTVANERGYITIPEMMNLK